MKIKPWSLPICAVILCGTWMIYSSHRTAEMEHQIMDLGELLQRSKQLAADQAKRKLADEQAAKKAEKRIDWKKMSALAQEKGGIRDGFDLMRLQELLKGMSLEELVTQLDEIEKMDLSSELKVKLKGLLFSPLAKLSPELACKRYVDCLSGEGQVRTYFPFTYKSWLQKDPAAAGVWLDQQIQAGILDSKSLKSDSSIRVALEGSLIANLMSFDHSQAMERISSMPEDLRKALFHEFSLNRVLTPENAGDYVTMARSTLSREEDAPDAVAEVLAGFVGKDSDFSRVDQLLTAASASPEEKRATVTRAFSYAVCGADWKMDQLTKATDWLKSSEPQAADEITGTALSMAAQLTRSYDQAMKLAQAYQEQSGNDAVMVAFLKNSIGDEIFAPIAKSKISSIKDPAERAALEALYSR
jgi:hypothetical protein